MMIVSLLILAGFAFYVMNSEERVRALGPVRVVLRHMKWAAALCLAGLRRFVVALLARNPWALAGLGTAAALVLTAGMHARYVRSLTDVRPEIERLVIIEDRTARTYEAAVAQFKLGAVSAEALAGVIKKSVIPELRAVRLRLKALDRIPDEHQPLIARAEEYLRLRDESWRLRAEALEKRSMAALNKADHTERASLEALARVQPTEQQ